MKNGPIIKYNAAGEIVSDKIDIPTQYLKGWVEFYKLKFKVDERVLIPRPETELLVDEVVAYAKRSNHPEERFSDEGSRQERPLTILDVGTGAGNIAISIAKNLPKAKIFATDVSEEALELAQENAKKHRVQNKIFFLKSDLLSVILGTNVVRTPESDPGVATLPRMTVDIIVTNLPYIPTSKIPYLDPSVKDFEPRIALDGGPDGFDLYRKLFQQISHKFTKKSRGVATIPPPRWNTLTPRELKLIVCEIDYTQGELAINESQKYFPKAEVEVKTDLAYKQRILVISF